jgi:FAD/FMN-containing dehydrogenase
MAALIAPSEFRNQKLPNLTSKESIASDAPNLLPLLGDSPHLKIITPSSPDFAKFNNVFQQDSPSKPLALVRPTSVQEVADIVRFATSASPPIPITVRGGGHDFWHRSNVAGALIIHLRELDEWEVSSDKKSVTIGGGTIGFNLVKFLETHGLAVALGGCPTVGVTGWSTCGGYGGLNGLVGFGVDQILAARLVTPFGEVVDADEETLWVSQELLLRGCFEIVEELCFFVHESYWKRVS